MTDKELQSAITPEDMRSAIYKHSQSDPLCRQVLTMADMAGLSGEDRFTTLAYHAIDALQKTRAAYLAHLVTCASPRLNPKDRHDR